MTNRNRKYFENKKLRKLIASLNEGCNFLKKHGQPYEGKYGTFNTDDELIEIFNGTSNQKRICG